MAIDAGHRSKRTDERAGEPTAAEVDAFIRHVCSHPLVQRFARLYAPPDAQISTPQAHQRNSSGQASLAIQYRRLAASAGRSGDPDSARIYLRQAREAEAADAHSRQARPTYAQQLRRCAKSARASGDEHSARIFMRGAREAEASAASRELAVQYARRWNRLSQVSEAEKDAAEKRLADGNWGLCWRKGPGRWEPVRCGTPLLYAWVDKGPAPQDLKKNPKGNKRIWEDDQTLEQRTQIKMPGSPSKRKPKAAATPPPSGVAAATPPTPDESKPTTPSTPKPEEPASGPGSAPPTPPIPPTEPTPPPAPESFQGGLDPGAEPNQWPPLNTPRSPTDPEIGLRNVDDYRPFVHAGAAEAWARSHLGIARIEYRGNHHIANLVNRGLLSMRRRSLPMPAGLVVDPARFPPDREDVAAEYDPTDGVIYFNPMEVWTDGGESIRRAGSARTNYLATDDPHHNVVHEYGHFLHHQLDPDLNQSRQAEMQAIWTSEGAEEEVRHAGMSARGRFHYLEFVAETFAALALGRHFQSDVIGEWYSTFAEKLSQVSL